MSSSSKAGTPPPSVRPSIRVGTPPPRPSETPVSLTSVSASLPESHSPSSAAPESPLTDRAATAFRTLTTSAAHLNAVSDELGKPIVSIEAALKKLNLGVSTWIEFAGDHDPNSGDFWDRELGYSKVGGRWGIAIRTSEGQHGDPQSIRSEEWLFAEAPRAFRLAAVDKKPELLEKLIVEADKTAEKLAQKIEAAQVIARAVTSGPRK